MDRFDMSFKQVKALTFDTGGTILDWHSGFRDALAAAGRTHGLNRDWASIANQLRRSSLGKMVNLGQHEPATHNIDDAHRSSLEELIQEHGLNDFSEEDRHRIAYEAPHEFVCWPDFVEALPVLRRQRICASFTILSYRMIIDTARRNGLHWDAVMSCEGIGKYKMLPEAYETVAHFLQMDPAEICMVACHHIDLDSAAAVGYRTAHVRRPNEWGPESQLDYPAQSVRDIQVDTFAELVDALAS
jgi:2-haloacid dehalogenase